MTTPAAVKTLRIHKGGGRYRTIHVPNKELKGRLRATLRETLNPAMMTLCDYEVVHGFMPGRNPATNAARHVGYDYSICMDLEDFFDTVTKEHLDGIVPDYHLGNCLLNEMVPQGFPTSPALANLAAIELDKLLSALEGAKYTRYADDLTISTNDWDAIPDLIGEVTRAVDQCGFKLNFRKTKVQKASAGRRIITGASVGPEGVKISRKLRRKARAAAHQGRVRAARGLCGWMGAPSPVCFACGEQINSRHDVSMHIFRHGGVQHRHLMMELPRQTNDLDWLEQWRTYIGGVPDYKSLMTYMKTTVLTGALTS